MSSGDDFNFDDIDLNDSDFSVDGGDATDDLFTGTQSQFDSGNQNQLDTQNQNSGSTLNTPDNTFFDDGSSNLDQANEGPDPTLAKKYIIIAVAGILFVLVAIFIGSRLLGNKNKSDKNNGTNTVISDNKKEDVNADEILGTQRTQNTTANTQVESSSQDVSVKYQKDENEFSWMEITDSEDIVYEEDYVEKDFFIDGIKHYARQTDGVIVVKTVLSGSISGMSGTYTIEVPYSKGVKLPLHKSFKVYVLFGEYNGNTVVADITY